MGKPFKLPGHTRPGINQRSEGDTDLPDGRSGSAAFQYNDSPAKDMGGFKKSMKKAWKKAKKTVKKIDRKLQTWDRGSLPKWMK